MLDLVTIQILISSILSLFPAVSPAISAFVMSLTNQLPALVMAGTDVSAFVTQQIALVQAMVAEKRDPTDDEWNALNMTVSAELSKLTAQAK